MCHAGYLPADNAALPPETCGGWTTEAGRTALPRGCSAQSAHGSAYQVPDCNAGRTPTQGQVACICWGAASTCDGTFSGAVAVPMGRVLADDLLTMLCVTEARCSCGSDGRGTVSAFRLVPLLVSRETQGCEDRHVPRETPRSSTASLGLARAGPPRGDSGCTRAATAGRWPDG